MTDLTERFPWGRVIRDHTIGEYTVREYHCKRAERSRFHAYVSGRDTNHSYGTLEAAIVGAIAYKAQGPNTQAAEMFCRMIEHDQWAI